MYKSLLVLPILGITAISGASERLPDMQVTATGYPTDIDEALSRVEIIDREEILRSAAGDIADLLRFYSGMEIGRNGGPGQATSLFIRGTESDQNLILIDGIPIRSGSVGSSALQHIDPQNIQRIEIVKGPQSTLWGSGAMGGVINIITRSGSNRGIHGGASLETGGNNTWRGSAELAVDRENSQWNANISGYRSDGYSPRTGVDDDRGYRNTSFSLSGNLDLGAHGFTLSHWQTQGNVEYLGFFLDPLDQDFLNSASSLRWEADIQRDWQSRLTLSHVRDEIDQNQSREKVHTRRSELEWRNDIGLSESRRLLLGLIGSRETVTAVAGYSPYDADTDFLEIYGRYDIRLGPHHLIGGLRYLDHEYAGDKLLWSLHYGYRFSPATRLTASAATGFRYPSANERFGFGGNPNLEPEESLSYELALYHDPAPGHRISASLFRNDIDNLIQFVFIPPFGGYNENVARTRIDGIELEYRYEQGPWSLSAAARYQDPRNRDNGQRLLRRAYHSQNIRLLYQIDDWSLGADMLFSGDRMDFGGITLDGYALVNLNASYRLSNDWQLYAKVENLFDEDYELANGYQTQGRIGYLGIRYTR